MNSNVQPLVMIRPVGKTPSVRPGSTKVAALAAADDAEAPVEVVVLTGLANMPLTNDASLDDSSVVMTLPLLSVPESAMLGTRRFCSVLL